MMLREWADRFNTYSANTRTTIFAAATVVGLSILGFLMELTNGAFVVVLLCAVVVFLLWTLISIAVQGHDDEIRRRNSPKSQDVDVKGDDDEWIV